MTNGPKDHVEPGEGRVRDRAVVAPPAESVDFDAVSCCGALLNDAVAGWGISLVRIVHLGHPDEVFAT